MNETLTIVTGNQGKKKEFEALLGDLDMPINYVAINLEEIQSLDIKEVARYKMLQAFEEKMSGYLLVDDTSLELEALGNLPGVFIKWFIKSLDLHAMYNLVKDKNEKALAKCCLCLGHAKNRSIHYFIGELAGSIVSPKQEESFGWDPIFLPNYHQKTYAQMSFDEKNQISHRSLAVSQLKAYLRKQA